ncbi:hypothetical protein [Arthrobacter sp.]|jgi:hypothetical protein|uniref:hypothetical protein n=1 Tax=Arthrobacter sp. TaxID=1667 RepID=UPI0025855E32|nr:hypothetical protein [Arthrobacter sp.]
MTENTKGPGTLLVVGATGSSGRYVVTFELVAEQGPAPDDLGPLFAALDKDMPGSVDGVRDQANMPDNAEPDRVRRDLGTLTSTK